MSITTESQRINSVGELGIIPLESCAELGAKVNNHIVSWREKGNVKMIPSKIFYSATITRIIILSSYLLKIRFR